MTYVEKIVKHYKGRKERAEQCLGALRELYSIYRDKKVFSEERCPLCRVVGSCRDCSWTVLRGASTCVLMKSVVSWGWVARRMKSILFWIVSYEKALKRL